MFGALAFVADHPLAWGCRRRQRRRTYEVGHVPTDQKERMRSAPFVDERMDFRRPAAAQTTDGLALLSPLWMARPY